MNEKEIQEALQRIVDEVERLNGEELDFENESYLVEFKDGFFFGSVNMETGELELKIHLFDENKLKTFYSGKSASELIGE